jgi:hypothetical protein
MKVKKNVIIKHVVSPWQYSYHMLQYFTYEQTSGVNGVQLYQQYYGSISVDSFEWINKKVETGKANK